MRIISAEEVEAALTWPEVMEIVKNAMMEVSKGNIIAPQRTMMPIDGPNGMGIMPGGMQNPPVHGIKLISLYPDNPKKGLSSHQGLMVVFDSKTGTPIAGLDAGALTALRTPAASVAATCVLARKNSEIFTIIGTGEQAHRHVEAFLACTDAKEIRIWGRRYDAAKALVERLQSVNPAASIVHAVEGVQQAVAGADVITCVTAAPSPILKGAWLEPGQHVNLVGSSIRKFREIDAEGVSKLRYFVDSRDSASSQAGEYLDELENGTIGTDYIISEIGDVFSGDVEGRLNEDEITGYKSLGVAAQDLSVSWTIVQKLGLA
ncbi:MAG: ornithine cyclodeaminase family protein [Rhizobiaceae bacterium]|nr:ornithine cyclodeaminase family protein [Rhizobiaceae bacterium]